MVELYNNINATYLSSFWGSIQYKNLSQVFEEIKGEKHKNYTEYLRKLNNESYEMYSDRKKSLPAALFCAEFKQDNRKKEGLKVYNSIMILDIDKLENKRVSDTLSILKEDPYVFACWKSPSGNGIKGLVKLEFEGMDLKNEDVDYNHKRAFFKLSDYFLNNHNIELDPSGNDFTRLCFLSYDNEISIKDTYQVFNIGEEEYHYQKKESKPKVYGGRISSTSDFILCNTIGKNSPADRTMISKIIKYLTKKSTSITESYDNWLIVAFAIANTFSFDLGKKYFSYISQLDGGKYDEQNCISFLEECYYNSRGEITFATLIHLAKEKGFNENRSKQEST